MTLPRSDVRPRTEEHGRGPDGPGEVDSVVRTVVLDAPPDQVWEAVTGAAMLREWLAPEVELEAHEGGAVRCRFEDGEERHGEVELVEEAERLAFSWHRDGAAPSRVELALDAVADGTRLTVIETGLRRGPTLLAAGWSAPLARLPLALGRLVLA